MVYPVVGPAKKLGPGSGLTANFLYNLALSEQTSTSSTCFGNISRFMSLALAALTPLTKLSQSFFVAGSQTALGRYTAVGNQRPPTSHLYRGWGFGGAEK